MSIFKDEVYDRMDWLEAACTPIICNLNNVLNEFPDEINMTYNEIVSHALTRYGFSAISTENVINNLYEKEDDKLFNKLSYDDKVRIIRCFDVVINGKPILNLEKKTLSGGEVKIVKIKEAFEDKEMEQLIGSEGLNDLYYVDVRDIPVERLNDIIELLGLFEARKSRSSKQKLKAIKDEMIQIMKANRWDIRDVALSNRVCKWIIKYLKDGNLAAYTNFCKLKVMTHNEAPIYSIEGEEKI